MGTMRLNDVVAEVVGDVIAGRAINKRQAAVDRWDDIDADGQHLAGIDGVVGRIDGRARALRVKAEKVADAAQADLPFQLPAAKPCFPRMANSRCRSCRRASIVRAATSCARIMRRISPTTASSTIPAARRSGPTASPVDRFRIRSIEV